MHRLRLVALLLFACVAGCSYDMPQVVSGTYLERQAGTQSQPRPLTATQVAALNNWAARHGGTWSRAWLREYVTYVSPVEATIQFSVGGSARLHVWSESVALVGESGYYRKQVSAQEVALLKEALRAQ